jgi:hypothetical protein
MPTGRSIPRIPFTTDYRIFESMARAGHALVDLHLLKSPALDLPIAKFQGPGNNDIVKVEYREAEGRVYINDNKYFDAIEPNVWDYMIGGYQVLDKWLSERKKHGCLDSSLDEPKTFCRIVTALAKTIEIQKQIDEEYIGVEKSTIKPPGTSVGSNGLGLV